MRTLLASRGGCRGDLSRFVEAAVNREILRETLRDVQVRNKDLDRSQIESLIEEELSAIAPTFWAGQNP